MENDLKRIGRRIRDLRNDKKWSQATLAEKTDLSPQYICQIEMGKKKASLSSLIRISAALEVSIDLLTDSTSYSPVSDYNQIRDIFDGCTPYERQILLESMLALKRILKENRIDH